MPEIIATQPIAVETVQRGLTVYRSNVDGAMPSPGRVDGAWGPRTQEALRAWVAVVAPSIGLDAARELAPGGPGYVPPAVGASTIVLRPVLVTMLTELAQSYRAPAPLAPRSGTPAVPGTSAPARVGGGSGLAVGAGVVVGLLVVGGAAWYFWGRK